jgi:hypothetical protein
MGLRAASETDTEDTTSDDISSSSASEVSDSSLDEVVDASTGTKKYVPKTFKEDGMQIERFIKISPTEICYVCAHHRNNIACNMKNVI